MSKCLTTYTIHAFALNLTTKFHCSKLTNSKTIRVFRDILDYQWILSTVWTKCRGTRFKVLYCYVGLRFFTNTVTRKVLHMKANSWPVTCRAATVTLYQVFDEHLLQTPLHHTLILFQAQQSASTNHLSRVYVFIYCTAL